MPTATRRSFLTAGGAMLTVAAAPVRPPAAQLTVPTVDALDVLIVTDAATFGPFLPDLVMPGMTVHRAGNGGGGIGTAKPNAAPPRMVAQPLLAEFGLSVLATSKIGQSERRVMIDFGYSKAVLHNNLALLDVEPASVTAAVLSHGHLDHYGGFAGLFGTRSTHAPIPLTVGGEEAFCERVAMIGNPPPVMGRLDRRALARAGFTVRIAPQPAIIAGHGFTTGFIPLGFEGAAIPTQMRPGVGCARALLDPGKRTVTQLPDDAAHELATAYVVKGLGLVVIASCSHRGVINSVRRAQAVSGVERVHAVIGGFHLVRPRTDDEARATVTAFAALNPRYIIPMHCTGEVFMAAALQVMPEKIVRPYVGTRLRFTA